MGLVYSRISLILIVFLLGALPYFPPSLSFSFPISAWIENTRQERKTFRPTLLSKVKEGVLLAALTPLLLNIDPLTYFLKQRNTQCPSSYTLLISYSSGGANKDSVNCLMLLRFKTFTESFTIFWWQVLVHRSLRASR
uniref:Orf137c n=1 Tax=Batis maritima TaxID=4436 RepID=A0A068BHQ8_BATMA|nr:orf137c [Batis maritima]AIC83408.1 orf137c [Batis maritima]